MHIHSHPPRKGNKRTILQLIQAKKYSKFAILSSPELKAQVRFSDRLASDRLYVNNSHLPLLLRNHWGNFNQTWHKAPLDDGNSSLFTRRATPLMSHEEMIKIKAKIYWWNLKIFYFTSTVSILTLHKVSLGERFQV